MAGIGLYSPEDVIFLLGGIYNITGIHEGTFISITKDSPLYSSTVTADGKVSRVHRNVPTHTLEITLSSLANDNLIFNAWAYSDGLLYGAMLPIFIKDANGTTVFYAPTCWLEAEPEVVYTMGVEGRKWNIKCAGANNVIGGNESGGVVDPNLAALGFLTADALNVLG